MSYTKAKIELYRVAETAYETELNSIWEKTIVYLQEGKAYQFK